MARKLTNIAEPTPTVALKSKIGGFFEGKLQSAGRIVKMGRGTGVVFEFLLNDTDMPISVKNDQGVYVDVANIEQGALVALFAPTVLQKGLAKAALGEMIRIVYLGPVNDTNGKLKYHNFDAEVI